MEIITPGFDVKNYMRTFLTTGAVGIVAALVIIVAATIFARILITPERVRATVLPVVEKALKRDVELGDISLSIFSGIMLHDVRIKERNNDKTFISASRAALRYRLLPLISLQIVVDELRLEEPQINVVRLPGGSFNFSDLIAEAEKADRGETTLPARTEPGTASSGLPINVTIATVSLSKGTILFTDESVTAPAPLQYTISRINARARSISLDESFPFECSCSFNDAPLSLEGRADIINRSANARIKLDNLDAMAFLPYFADQIPGRLSSLTANLDANVSADLKKIVSSGTLALRDIDLTLDALAKAPIREAQILVEYDVSADLATSVLDVRSTRVNANGIIAEASGSLEQLNSKPRLALDLKLPGLEILKTLTSLPNELVTDLRAMDPAGTVDVQARLEGPVDQGMAVLKNARIRLHNVQATTGGIRPNLNGNLDLNGDRLTSQDLVIDAAGSQARIDLSAKNLFDKPVITQHINAEHVDLDALIKNVAPEASAGTKIPAKKTKQPDPKTANPAEEIGPFDMPVSADGTVKITRALYRGLMINDVTVTYRLADNILTIEKMSGQTAGGTFSQSGHVDLGRKGLAYQSTLNLQGMQTDPVISACMPRAAGTLFGNLNLDCDVSGHGTLPETLKQNLICASRIDINNGRISGSSLAQGLAGFLSIDELRELTFSTFGGTVDIKQGRAHLDTELLSTDVRMSPKGVIGLDGSLDLSLNAALSPALMKKIDKRGALASLLTDKQGWSQVPLKIKGSYTQPRFKLNNNELRQQAEEKVLDTLQQRLFERNKEPATNNDTQAGGQTQATSPPQNSEGQPAEDSKTQRKKKRQERRKILEDTLQGILGR